jgi:3-hydroxyacyl-CoA dehydrogenase/enoyl-CoA hydratase/3-hydroxybutyryl-CoA epimerase
VARFGEGEPLSGIQQRLVFAMINEAAKCLEEGVVREAWMVDLGMVLGTGFAPFRGGPLRLVDAWGVPKVVATLEQLLETCGTRFKPSALLVEMRDGGRTFYDGTHAAPQPELAATGDGG